MQYRLVAAIRTVLTITGLVLLAIFGARAAAQADNMKLAGGHNSGLPVYVLHKLQSIADLAGESKVYATTNKMSGRAAATGQVSAQTLEVTGAADQGQAQTGIHVQAVTSAPGAPSQDSGNPAATAPANRATHAAPAESGTVNPQSSAADSDSGQPDWQPKNAPGSKNKHATSNTPVAAHSAAGEHTGPGPKQE